MELHQMVQTRQTAASGSGTPVPEVNEQPAAGAVPPQAQDELRTNQG